MDIKILEFIRSHLKCRFMDWFMKNLSMLFDFAIPWFFVFVMFLIFKSTRLYGITFVLAFALEGLICNVILKKLSKRERPFTKYDDFELLINPPKDYSFPSGHTLCGFLCSTIIYLYSPLFGTVAFVLAFMIAFSRLYLYVHYPSDVVFGAVFGVAIALGAYEIIALLIRVGILVM